MLSTSATFKMRRLSIRYGSLANTAFIVVLAFMLGSAAGYRLFGEGRDFLSYVNFYAEIRIFGEQGFFRFEPGFVWVASVFKLILNAEVELLLAVLAALSLLIKFAIFSAHRRPVLTILFYLCC